MKNWNPRQALFQTMPIRSFVTFCLAVAFTFAAIGVVNDLFDLEHSDIRHLVLRVLTTAGFAVLWVLVLYRRMPKLLILLAVAQAAWLFVSASMMPPPNHTFTANDWRTNVDLHGLLLIVLILFSYGWFGTFFQFEGKRYFAAHTEIELASRIQKQLVPPIRLKEGNIEVYGFSIPSGAVGGDLLDVVKGDGFACAYVADVAGHGVAAGVLMSMVKTAVRMHFMSKPPSGQRLLEALNNTLIELTETSAYSTFAYLLISQEPKITYSVAAHPSIYHFQKSSGALMRHLVENFPVAMFANTQFETAFFDFLPGDLIAIVTDGLTEVFDRKGNELGELYIEDTLTRFGDRPLTEIAERIFKSAKEFGKVLDDQTLLLVRRSAS